MLAVGTPPLHRQVQLRPQPRAGKVSATVPGAAERAAECALPSCAANVAAVADADGAAKWRADADAAADGRAFVTLVSAAGAAAECCLYH